MNDHQFEMIIHYLERITIILASLEEKLDKGTSSVVK